MNDQGARATGTRAERWLGTRLVSPCLLLATGLTLAGVVATCPVEVGSWNRDERTIEEAAELASFCIPEQYNDEDRDQRPSHEPGDLGERATAGISYVVGNPYLHVYSSLSVSAARRDVPGAPAFRGPKSVPVTLKRRILDRVGRALEHAGRCLRREAGTLP